MTIKKNDSVYEIVHVVFDDGSFDDILPLDFLCIPFRDVVDFEGVFVGFSSLLFSVGSILFIA